MRPPKPRPLWLTQGRKLRQGWDGGAGSWPRGAGWAREARTDPAPTAVRRQARPPSLCVVRGLAPVAPLVLLPASGDLVQLLRRLPVDGPVPAPGERGRGSPREQGPRSCGPPAHPSSCGGTLGCRAGLGGREAARACSAGERRVLWEQAAPPDREAPSGDTQVARRPRTPCRKIHGPRGGRGLQSPLRA